MASKRTSAKWDALTPTYRARLERGGITRAAYLSGAKLQKARGQAKAEPRLSAARAAARQAPSTAYPMPSASTVGRWRNRAAARGVIGGDWDAALRSADSFDTVKEEVRKKERLHAKWAAKGGGKFGTRLDSEDIEDLPVEWGDTWSYYH